MDILAEVLEIEAKKTEHYKTTDVEKHLELEFDLGNLLAMDTNDLDLQKLKSNKREEYLTALARDDAQLLLNKLWELPNERVEEIVAAKLPSPSTVIPREKRVPRPKPLTKWQQYAKEKGIANKKKTNVTWDDTMQKWIPRFGYRHAEAQKNKTWLLEVPQNADPMEDQFAKAASAKKEKVAKNEYQRLRNLAAAHKIKVPREGLPPVETPSSDQLGHAVSVARVSTASLGRHQATLSKEKPASTLAPKKPRLDHSKITLAVEKSSQLDILNSVLGKKPRLNLEKAVNREIHNEQSDRFEEKKTERKKGGGTGRGNKKGRKPSIPSKGHKGGRAAKGRAGKVSIKKAGGRKRR